MTQRQVRVIKAEQNAEAWARQRSVIAQTASQQASLERENELRVRRAELEAVAASRENEAKVGAECARVVVEQQLEQERIILNHIRLEADMVAPASAVKPKCWPPRPPPRLPRKAAPGPRLSNSWWKPSATPGRKVSAPVY
ncbi:hypothetical protein ACI3L1_00430 [Deinococcus sp. SM5_A1]|uniref:hypothetical protein n=1 Tax=Deinococcus sp. SM5_A1 TaxID=3379094 RepID=UPI00385DB9F5